MFGNIYRGRRVLITGNTGFKGSWLALWLLDMNADVVGYSIDVPTVPSHHSILGLEMETIFGDIRDLEKLERTIRSVNPDIVFHLAAQSLVRRSYQNPLETFGTNLMGTANLLEACRRSDSIKAVLIATSDKCYENREEKRAFCENDPLGGHDPYSASKACAELTAAAYRRSFFTPRSFPLMATARSGNVIGGGDWSDDRLIPDIIRSVTDKTPLMIRYPNATRPWQHVLDPLSGYLLLGQRLLEAKSDFASSWNFGPDSNDQRTVSSVLQAMKTSLEEFSWRQEDTPQLHEAGLLRLNCAKARNALGWQPTWFFEKAIALTADWYRSWLREGIALSSAQLSEYVNQARKQGMAWTEEGK